MFMFLFCSFFFPFGFLHYICFFPWVSIPQYASSSPYNVFFLLPLEVDLHTYLTTWLSSCPVEIFPRSHLIFAKIQIINKVSPLKWINLNSHHVVFRARLFYAYLLWVEFDTLLSCTFKFLLLLSTNFQFNLYFLVFTFWHFLFISFSFLLLNVYFVSIFLFLPLFAWVVCS